MNKAYAIVCAVILSLATSCSSDEKYQQEPNEAPSTSEYVGDVVISARDFEYEVESRTSFNINGNKAEFLWAENDTVGIFPDTGNQVEFPMSEGAGTKTAAFDGGGWRLKSSNTYYAYYPFSGKNYHIANAKTKIPVSYAGQIQTGNNSLSHLGAYDFMVAKGVCPENGGLNFQFEHLGALVQLTISVAKPMPLQSITLETTGDDFTIDGYVDITTSMPSITAVTKSNALSIPLKGVATTSVNEEVVIYFMLAPTDLSAKSLSLTVFDLKNTSMTVALTPTDFQAGKAYAFSAAIENDPYDGPEYVDLGLSSGLKWASLNIGAKKPSDYGDYFAWGEIETKNTYTEDNSDWYDYRYSILQYLGIINSEGCLNPQYDAATVNWGLSWRMPTENDILEIRNECSWTIVTQDGHKGFKVTGPNGNSIFLPFAGWRGGDDENTVGSYGSYWSGESVSDSSVLSIEMDMNYSGYRGYNGDDRWIGKTVRPVSEW